MVFYVARIVGVFSENRSNVYFHSRARWKWKKRKVNLTADCCVTVHRCIKFQPMSFSIFREPTKSGNFRRAASLILNKISLVIIFSLATRGIYFNFKTAGNCSCIIKQNSRSCVRCVIVTYTSLCTNESDTITSNTSKWKVTNREWTT